MLEVMLALVLASVPNPKLTPGAVRPLTKAQICATKWGLDRRFVTLAMKRQVAANYGLALADIHGSGLCCEIDHLIPRELGGADTVANLWAQPWSSARAKDGLENSFHARVCAGTISLRTAQAQMRKWGR